VLWQLATTVFQTLIVGQQKNRRGSDLRFTHSKNMTTGSPKVEGVMLDSAVSSGSSPSRQVSHNISLLPRHPTHKGG
jgi:hypothetical protein